MEERRFLRLWTWAVLADLWVAGAAFVAFMVFVGGPAAYAAFTVPTLWWAIYLACAPVVVAVALRLRIAGLVQGASSAGVSRVVTLEMPALVAMFVAGAAVVVVMGAGGPLSAMSGGGAVVVVGAVLTSIAYCVIPLFLLLQRLAGKFFGPRMSTQPIISSHSFVAVAIGVTVVGSSAFLLSGSLRIGAVSMDGLAIWILIFCYASCGPVCWRIRTTRRACVPLPI
ncbi:MAG: hypothetical protein HC809_03375 [Gammaproteobacteria bacterium]|nr:hypothetical protein [Gammaproteobacteria bacterium]